MILHCLYSVNKITGRESKASNISYVITPEDINLFFQRINTYTQYSALELLPIPERTHVPSLDVVTVRRFMTRLKCTAGRISLLAVERFCTPPCSSCHQVFSLFTQTAVSSSLFRGTLPTYHQFLKSFHCCAQLRPISLTNIIMRLFERLVCKLETFMEHRSVIGMDHFAYKKHCNTTMGLIKCQHQWLRWLDDDVDFV